MHSELIVVAVHVVVVVADNLIMVDCTPLEDFEKISKSRSIFSAKWR